MKIALLIDNVNSSNLRIESSRVPAVGEFVYIPGEHILVEVNQVIHAAYDQDVVAVIVGTSGPIPSELDQGIIDTLG